MTLLRIRDSRVSGFLTVLAPSPLPQRSPYTFRFCDFSYQPWPLGLLGIFFLVDCGKASLKGGEKGLP